MVSPLSIDPKPVLILARLQGESHPPSAVAPLPQLNAVLDPPCEIAGDLDMPRQRIQNIELDDPCTRSGNGSDHIALVLLFPTYGLEPSEPDAGGSERGGFDRSE